MKRIIALALAMISVLSFGVSAKVGDKVGTALNTDIVAYINNYGIPSFAVNGQSCIIAEDLRFFGFDVTWDGANRSLSITKSKNITPHIMTQIEFAKTAPKGSFFADVLETDIVTYAEGIKVPSYAINGYTMVPMEELTMLGTVVWNPELWILEMHVNGLPERPTRQEIKIAVFNDAVFNLHEQPYSAIKAIYGRPNTSFYYDGGVAFQYYGLSFFFDKTYDLVAEPKPNAECTHIYTTLEKCVNGVEGCTFTADEFEKYIGVTLKEEYDEMDEMYMYYFFYNGTRCKIYAEREDCIAYNNLVIIQDMYKK